MKKGIYFKLQLKRTLKMYPAILFITLITIVSIALTCVLLMQSRSQSEDRQKISVGVVGDTKDTYLEMGIYALKNFDNSRFFMEFVEMEEEAAVEALKKREINGYVYIPSDFVKGIYYGDNIPAKYVTLNSPEGFGSILTAEITQVISELVTGAQNGISSMQFFAYEKQRLENFDENVFDMNMDYIELILSRHDIYELEVLGIADSLSAGGYYICGVIIFFMLLWGISCSRLLSSKNISLSRSLNSCGMKPMHQLLCEYGPFLIVTFVTLIIFAVGFGFIAGKNNFGIPELETADISGCVVFVFKMLPVIVMITMMHMAFYELVTGTVSGILFQFLIAIGSGYISGCFYPNYFFPDRVQRFAEVLPPGAGFSYLRKLLSDTLVTEDLILPVIYTVIFAVVTIIMRKWRMAGNRK